MRPILTATLLILSSLWNPPIGLGLQLSEVIQNCRIDLRDTTADSNFQRFSDTQLTAFINEGQRDVVNRTWLIQSTYSFGLSSGTRFYPLPADFLIPMRVMLNNQRLQATAYNALDQNFTDWTKITSTSTAYFIDTFMSTTTYIGFYPLPRFPTGESAVVLQYAQNPTLLSAATDIPFNGKNSLYVFHDILADYCALKGWLIQSRPDMSGAYGSLYSARVAEIKEGINRSPDYNPSSQGYRGTPNQ